MAKTKLLEAPNRCTANCRHCRKCEYKYLKTDKKWQDGGVCPVCGEDRRCERMANNGMPVCQMHGGGSPHKLRPSGQPRIHTVTLLERVAARQNDPKLLEQNVQIAAISERMGDLLTRIDSGESSKAWVEIKDKLPQYFDKVTELWTAYERAYQALNADNTPYHKDKVREAFFALRDFINDNQEQDTLLEIVNQGAGASMTWEEYADYAERARKIVDSQRKWELDKRYYITAKEALQIPVRVYNLLEQYITNPQEKAALYSAIEQDLLRYSDKDNFAQVTPIPRPVIEEVLEAKRQELMRETHGVGRLTIEG